MSNDMSTARSPKLPAPRNPVSGTIYQGINIETLITGEWATFLQWKKVNRIVKKGSKGKKITRFVETDVKKNGKIVKESFPRSYIVFEINQTDEIKNRPLPWL